MEAKSIILLSFVTACVVWALSVIYRGIQADAEWKKEQDKERKEAELRFNEEKNKPKYLIKFKLVTGDTKETKSFNPNIVGTTLVYTSKEEANLRLYGSYGNGHFTDSDGITYPACNVESAWLEKEQ